MLFTAAAEDGVGCWMLRKRTIYTIVLVWILWDLPFSSLLSYFLIIFTIPFNCLSRWARLTGWHESELSQIPTWNLLVNDSHREMEMLANVTGRGIFIWWSGEAPEIPPECKMQFKKLSNRDYMTFSAQPKNLTTNLAVSDWTDVSPRDLTNVVHSVQSVCATSAIFCFWSYC
jgi:hypothetical protein